HIGEVEREKTLQLAPEYLDAIEVFGRKLASFLPFNFSDVTSAVREPLSTTAMTEAHGALGATPEEVAGAVPPLLSDEQVTAVKSKLDSFWDYLETGFGNVATNVLNA